MTVDSEIGNWSHGTEVISKLSLNSNDFNRPHEIYFYNLKAHELLNIISQLKKIYIYKRVSLEQQECMNDF